MGLAGLVTLWGVLLYLATGPGWRFDSRLDPLVDLFTRSETMSAVAPIFTWGLALAAAGALVVIWLLVELVKKS